MRNLSRTKVSVIIPLYNAEIYMNLAVSSVQNQSHTNTEIILVDDGSVDNTLLMCNQLAKDDTRIVVIHQENAGPGRARNSGLDRATGEYICFVDSDDRLEENALEILLKAVDEDFDLVQCRSLKMYETNQSDDELWERNEKILSRLESMEDYLYCPKPIVRFSVWAKLIRRSVVEHLRFPELSNSEDVVFNAYLIDSCQKIKFIPDILYYVTIRDDSLSHRKITVDKIEAALQCNEEIVNLMQSKKEYQHLIPRIYWSSAMTMIRNACLVYKNDIPRKAEIVKYLSNRCKKLEVPMKEMNVHQKITIHIFRKWPNFLVRIMKYVQG